MLTDAVGRSQRPMVHQLHLIVAWMSRWEAIVLVRDDMEQFIKGVAICKPGGSFLLCAKQIAVFIEGERDRKANSSANGLTL